MALQPAAVSIAAFADTIPFSRSLPAGKATPAWNTTQTLASQKTSPSDQPYFFSSVPTTAPQPYSKTLTANMAAHGSQTIQVLERPIRSCGVSPTRYTRPLWSRNSW